MRQPNWWGWVAVIVACAVMLMVGMRLHPANGQDLVFVPKDQIEKLLANHEEALAEIERLKERIEKLLRLKVTCA
jgi:hypothetical protein